MKSIKLSLFVILFSILFAACNTSSKKNNNETPFEDYTIQYAKGFTVNKYQEYTQVTVQNPWDSSQVLANYILVNKDKELPANLPLGTIVRVPLESAVAYSTIHASTLHELNSIGIVTGVCEPEYMNIEEIIDGVKSEKIINLGMANNPDIEKIIILNPEVIFASPINGHDYGTVVKTQIPIIETPDYTEPLPLGRAEWVRFYSLFIGKERLADSLFFEIEREYNEIIKIVSNSKTKPRVFNDMKYQSSWNMPGGKSYMANMLADAGGDYVWSDNASTTFMPLSFESVLDEAGDADIWLIRYFSHQDLTYSSLAKEYKLYTSFDAYKNKNIWVCNTQSKKYYEDLPIHPERILNDYAYIFNPDLFLDYVPQYFEKLKE